MYQSSSASVETIPVPIPDSVSQLDENRGIERSRTFEIKKGGKSAVHIQPIKIQLHSFPKDQSSIAYRVFKNLFDVVGAVLLLIISLPAMILVAIAVKVTSPGPLIFRQTRLTQSGRVFTMYKFRTMRQDAEEKSGAVWAEKNDPRVTAVGAFLRTTRLDELPQLINVLRGDMSLIGPRPERPEFSERIVSELPSFTNRLRVKAGLTGLAQVGSGYSSCMDDHRKKLAWDRLYIRRKSIGLDIWIVYKTVHVVFSGRGAR